MASNVVSTETVKAKRASPFPWNEERTYAALQIMAHKKPYEFNSGSPQSVGAWKEIVQELHQVDSAYLQHDVNVKKVRDHLNQVKVIKNALDKQSGIVQDTTPMQDLMDQVNDERSDKIDGM